MRSMGFDESRARYVEILNSVIDDRDEVAIGLAADAPHPATAKLFIDFLLSEEGQRAVAEGGLSSYREGVEGPGLHTYQELVDEVGEDKVIQVAYEEIPQDEIDAWLKQFYDLAGN